MNGFELEHVFEQKDLGVYHRQRIEIVNKSNMLVGLIRRNFTFLGGPLFKKLFTTFVRPHIEYAQTVWSPF